MDRGAWQVAVAKSWTQLSDWAHTHEFCKIKDNHLSWKTQICTPEIVFVYLQWPQSGMKKVFTTTFLESHCCKPSYPFMSEKLVKWTADETHSWVLLLPRAALTLWGAQGAWPGIGMGPGFPSAPSEGASLPLHSVGYTSSPPQCGRGLPQDVTLGHTGTTWESGQ